MILLYSTIEVDLWDYRDPIVKLQLFLPLLDICIGSWMLRDWLADLLADRGLSSVVYLPSYFALSRSQSFGLLCLLLAMLFCLLLALLFSVLFIISPLLDVERCSASASSLRCSSRCPRTCVAPLSSFHHKLVHCGSVSDSHHLLLGCGSICISLSPLPSWLWLSLILSRDTLW